MSQNTHSMRTVLLGWCSLLAFFFIGLWLGNYNRKVIDAQEITEAYEEKFREELDSVYQLLSAQAFSIRTNMNLSLKTNHYLTHEFHEDVCPDCLEHYKYLVENMPPLPEADQVWFDFFNKDLVELAEKILDEKETTDE